MDILQAIASVGFPIVACCGCAFFFSRVNDNYRSDIKEINAQHKEEMKAITDALNNNTLALQKLADKMEERNNDED